jgi:hypothetical protein
LQFAVRFHHHAVTLSLERQRLDAKPGHAAKVVLLEGISCPRRLSAANSSAPTPSATTGTSGSE